MARERVTIACSGKVALNRAVKISSFRGGFFSGEHGLGDPCEIKIGESFREVREIVGSKKRGKRGRESHGRCRKSQIEAAVVSNSGEEIRLRGGSIERGSKGQMGRRSRTFRGRKRGNQSWLETLELMGFISP